MSPYISIFIASILCFIPSLDFKLPMGGDYKYNDTTPGHNIKQQDFAVSCMDNNNNSGNNNNNNTPVFARQHNLSQVGLHAGTNYSKYRYSLLDVIRVSPCTNFATLETTCNGQITRYQISNPSRISPIAEEAKARLESNNTLNNNVSASNEFIRNWALSRRDNNARHSWAYYSRDQRPINYNQTVTPDALKSEPVNINSAVNPLDPSFTDQFKRGYIAGGDNEQGLHNIRCALDYIAEQSNVGPENRRVRSTFFTANHEMFMLERLKHIDIESYRRYTNNETTGLNGPNTQKFREMFPYTESFNESLNANSEVIASIIFDREAPDINNMKALIWYKHELKQHVSKSLPASEVYKYLTAFDDKVKQYLINEHASISYKFGLGPSSKSGIYHRDLMNRKLTKQLVHDHFAKLRSYYAKPRPNVSAEIYRTSDVPIIPFDPEKLHRVSFW